MADPVRGSPAGPESPPWGDVRQQLLMYGEICATAAVSLALRGPHAAHAAMMIRQATDALRDACAQLRPPAFSEAVVEAAAERAADEALAAAGMVPPQRPRRLRAVTGPMPRP